MKEITIKNRVWTKDSVKTLLQNNNKAVIRALKLLYSFQTVDERWSESAIEANGKGFNSFDSELLSNFAEKLLRGKGLSQKQMEIARKRILKYSGQIFNYMEENNVFDK